MEEQQFDERLAKLFQECEAKPDAWGEAQRRELKILLCDAKAEMNAGAYVQIIYLAGLDYERRQNRNAARYCAMRMLWLKECKEKRRKKAPALLLMDAWEMTPAMQAFMERYTDFLEETYRSIDRRVLLLTGGLVLIVFFLLWLLLKIPLTLSLIEAVLLGIANYVLQRRRLPDMFQRRQTEAIAQYTETELQEFARPYLF